MTKYLVLAVLAIQIGCAIALKNTPVFSIPFLAVAYVIGATANQNLFLAIHEISHNLAFKSPTANRLLAIVANLPIGLPYSASFRPYHLTHHKSLGVDGLDTDLPTAFEAFFLDSVLGKAFFCTFQLVFYAIRPIFVYKVPFTRIHYLNVGAQLAFDYLLVRFAGGKALGYLILSSFFAGSLHPVAGHFIAEHYIFEKQPKQQPQQQTSSSSSTKSSSPNTNAAAVPMPETFSYYGPLNLLTYNVGLHNEHHDFPAIPWSRLPVLHEMAKEFYADQPHHRSWTWVIWQFIWDKEVGLWCRVKRSEGGRKVGSDGGSGGGWKESELGNNESEGAAIPGVC